MISARAGLLPSLSLNSVLIMLNVALGFSGWVREPS